MAVFQQLFVLKEALDIPDYFKKPDIKQTYDYSSHLWRWRDNGIPVVLDVLNKIKSTQQGENKIKASADGIEKPEGFSFIASSYGETTITKTSEGIDQSETSYVQASSYGETTITETGEGEDATEVSTLNLIKYFKCF